NVFLKEQANQAQGGGGQLGWPGKSPAMTPVYEWVRQSGPTDATVLITGETGTGKEVIARQIHQNSPRRKERFVPVNCGAIPEGLLESELFGHEKGSFTGASARKIGKFEWANGGTLFLDEIGELPAVMQVKLLRVLQERELQRLGGHEIIPLNLRIIAATNQELKEQMEKGSFRKDLYYRLNVVPIHLPPLRERLEDLEAFGLKFLERFSRKLRKKAVSISPLSLDLMRSYSWPGNIRELENVVERSVILMREDHAVLEPGFLPPEIRALDPSPGSEGYLGVSDMPDVKHMIDRIEWKNLVHAMNSEGSMDSFLRKIEWAMAQRAISKYGSKTEAARVLKRTYRWIRKLEKEMTEGPSA
ncbi:MAG TPA: sigma 54-interacting transcriptional regulator, partial [Nitrospiria bacterium]|nr:sigma 54-interacting transcriptional regulator [Nitrospiria bacterium]